MFVQRKTINANVSITGIGMHSGIYTRVELYPARAGNGIQFVREDLNGLRIPALQASTTALDYATTVGRDDVSVGTVEHLLAALNACGVTDVDYAVAETGTVVIRHRPEHGRLLSLVPFVHVAIVEPKCMVPDLIDLFAVLKRDGTGSGVPLISGPSKTADIEMNTVIGVHGPNIVKAFVLN